MTRNEELRIKAEEYCAELSRHEVLRDHWDRVSLILKGSVARGAADQYSDIDFMFYCSGETLKQIVAGYREKDLSSREDGLFVPLPEWIGHYSFETYDALRGYFLRSDMPQVWECTHVSVLHDPGSTYAKIVEDGVKGLFENPLELIKEKYLNLMLTLDWLTHPLIRGDLPASLLHASGVLRDACRLCYLVDGAAYPHDKWLFHYMGETSLGASCRDLLLEYARRASDAPEPHLELAAYPQFALGVKLTEAVVQAVRGRYGDRPWLGEWYLYV